MRVRAPPAVERCPPSLSEIEHHLLAQVQQRRHAEGEARDDRDGEGEQQHLPVERDLERSRDAVGVRGEHRAQAGEAQRRAERAADDGEQHALGQELPQQAPTARAERRADREFPLPRFGAREDQVRQVGAGDEQHESHRALQHPQRRADPAHHVGLQRRHLQHVALVVAGGLAG